MFEFYPLAPSFVTCIFAQKTNKKNRHTPHCYCTLHTLPNVSRDVSQNGLKIPRYFPKVEATVRSGRGHWHEIKTTVKKHDRRKKESLKAHTFKFN